MFSGFPARYERPWANVNIMSIPLLNIYSPMMSMSGELLHFCQYCINIPPIVKGYMPKNGGFHWSLGLLGIRWVDRKPRHPFCSNRGSQRPQHYQNRVMAECLIPKMFLAFLPPLGRESLKSPSMASQVLPSPPQTRQRSSFASEFRMLSQPTCFKINKTKSEVRRSV